MNLTDLEPDFANAVRSELAAIGTKASYLQRQQRRLRLVAIGIGVLAIGLASTGAAIVVTHFPGSTQVTPITEPVDVTRTGTATIDLGPAPSGANTVIIDVTCISSSGKISVPTTDGESQDATGHVTPSVGTADWDCALRPTLVHNSDGYLEPGAHSITVTADPGTTWRASARYASSTVTPFGVNAHGQTFGQANNVNGEPDLEGAQATNGKIGYVFNNQLREFRGCGYISVYKSDGTTVIGEFSIGMEDGHPTAECADLTPSPLTVP